MLTTAGKFYLLIKGLQALETQQVEVSRALESGYNELVQLCTHDAAIEIKSTARGMGSTRRCKICGVTDFASEGGTPGDEYDYGYPGRPSRSFWGDCEVEITDDSKIFDSYKRTHNWRVRNGEAYKW